MTIFAEVAIGTVFLTRAWRLGRVGPDGHGSWSKPPADTRNSR